MNGPGPWPEGAGAASLRARAAHSSTQQLQGFPKRSLGQGLRPDSPGTTELTLGRRASHDSVCSLRLGRDPVCSRNSRRQKGWLTALAQLAPSPADKPLPLEQAFCRMVGRWARWHSGLTRCLAPPCTCLRGLVPPLPACCIPGGRSDASNPSISTTRTTETRVEF